MLFYNLFLFVILFFGCKLQANPVYYSYQNPPSSNRAPFVQSYRPYWASYYTAVPSQFIVGRPQTPNIAYAFNLINTRNTCLTNDYKSPESAVGNATEQTTGATTASCPSPNQLPYVAAGMRDPLQKIAPMLLELFNPYVVRLMEQMTALDRPHHAAEATTAGAECTEGNAVSVTTAVCDTMTETCTSNTEIFTSEVSEAEPVEGSEATECIEIQSEAQQTTCVPVEDESSEEEPELITPESTDDKQHPSTTLAPLIQAETQTEDIKTNLVEQQNE